MIRLLTCFLFASNLLVTGCMTRPPRDVNNLCHIFKEYPAWHYHTHQAKKRWHVPVTVQMAIMHQESKFDAYAMPPRKKWLGIFPGARPSTAYGYSQALNGTWRLYQNQHHRFNASRNSFKDAVDFMGWYASLAQERAGISPRDPFRLYLAYHEGVSGYLNKTYLKKPWLIRVAHKVSRRARWYQAQLKNCHFKE